MLPYATYFAFNPRRLTLILLMACWASSDVGGKGARAMAYALTLLPTVMFALDDRRQAVRHVGWGAATNAGFPYDFRGPAALSTAARSGGIPPKNIDYSPELSGAFLVSIYHFPLFIHPTPVARVPARQGVHPSPSEVDLEQEMTGQSGRGHRR
jgi:hypothetical protein